MAASFECFIFIIRRARSGLRQVKKRRHFFAMRRKKPNCEQVLFTGDLI